MRRTVIIIASAVFVLILLCVYVFFTPMSHSEQTEYIYVRQNDTRENILSQLDGVTHFPQRTGLKILALLSGYGNNLHTGRYAIHKKDNAITVFRVLRGGRQEPVSLTIPCVRTMRDLSHYLGEHLMLDSLEFMYVVSDSTKVAEFGVDTANVYCLFIPDTYEVYWNISVDDFLNRMKRESTAFWTKKRLDKAEAIPLTPDEVYTLASIIDEETANKAEKPDIAGMYINRLHDGMPLQADPTIKFAHGDFSLRRIYHDLLNIKSPYNTYRNEGLLPGPIRIASVDAIDAVLDYTRHNYLYMCAKEDFSGTHRFARTYKEHLANAARYSKALNERGIK